MKISDDMEKIMFNDRYGLTEAVINGCKTETRRVEPICNLVDGCVELGYTRIEVVKNRKVRFHDDRNGTYVEEKTRYAIGEIVAVAQSYKDAGVNPDSIVSYKEDGTPVTAIQSPGWQIRCSPVQTLCRITSGLPAYGSSGCRI